MSQGRRADTPTSTEAANLIHLVRAYSGLGGSEGKADAVETINAMSLSDAQQTLESAIGIIVGQVGDDMHGWSIRFLTAIANEPQAP